MTDFAEELFITIARKLRKHRSFWMWPIKSVMERGAVSDLLDSMHLDGDTRYWNPRSTGKDWPDCEVDDESGNVVAAEVTELVDEEAVRRAQRGEMVFSYWKDEQIVEQVSRILVHKDAKSYHGGLYGKVILVIHTDEFTGSRLFPVVRGARFAGLQNIDEAFIIVSYDPYTGRYPWCEIPLN